MTSWIKKIALLFGAAALFACSSGNGTPPLVDSSGHHPADWLAQHGLAAASLRGTDAAGAAAAAAAVSSACTECHGKDLSGGIAKVSCFTAQTQSGQLCHATVIGHPLDWNHAIQHGQSGAMASAGISSGFAYCTTCHGADYRGGVAVSCFSCHHTAPHPPAPWIGGNLSHTTTSPTDAAACFPCHAGGRNFGPELYSAPSPTSPAAPTPDCFNNTLCHGGQVNPPHAAGAAYLNAAQHGSDATGNNPGKPELSLSACRSCHAGPTGRFNLTTNNMASGCESCHSAYTAHPVPWLPARSYANATPANPNTTSHATVSATNLATDCALCHGAALDGVGAKGLPPAPSCTTGNAIFGTSCHATSPLAAPRCTSCHPHDQNGGAQPTTGAHAKHLVLPGVSCDACHAGGGADPATRMGGARHANGFLDISTVSYWGRNGGLRYDRGLKTCASVRCHGGQTTPSWATGSLVVSLDCLKCHQQGNAGNTPQTPQFNSFYSGLYIQAFTPTNLHQFHLDPNNWPVFPNLKNVVCISCHSPALLTVDRHFGGLALIGFQATAGNLPGDTIQIPGVYLKDPLTGSYPGTCSNVTCHTIASPNASWGK